jgi:DNA-binding response OmpR family regulator
MQVLVINANHDPYVTSLRSALARRGIYTFQVSSGRRALGAVDDADLALVSSGFSDFSEVAVCRTIRSESGIPLIVIGERPSPIRRIMALDGGADDYMDKPCDIDELQARIDAILRRRRLTVPVKTVVGALDIHPSAPVVSLKGRDIKLSKIEVKILSALTAARGSVCTRENICKRVWGDQAAKTAASLRVHICALRAKIGHPEIIETVHGVGYRLGVRLIDVDEEWWSSRSN